MDEREAVWRLLSTVTHPANLIPGAVPLLRSQEDVPAFLAAIPQEWPLFRRVVVDMWLPHEGFADPRFVDFLCGPFGRDTWAGWKEVQLRGSPRGHHLMLMARNAVGVEIIVGQLLNGTVLITNAPITGQSPNMCVVCVRAFQGGAHARAGACGAIQPITSA